MDLTCETENPMLPTRSKLIKLGFSINGDCPFCHIIEENIDHIFKDCDLAINIGNTIINNCSTPINTSLTIVNWLDSLWNNKSFYRKLVGNVLEKVITILWAIQTHRNIIVFNNKKCNPIYVLELAKRVIYKDEDYKNCTNIPIVSKVAGTNISDAGKRDNPQNWCPPIRWIKLTLMPSKPEGIRRQPLATFAETQEDVLLPRKEKVKETLQFFARKSQRSEAL